jgi:succinoglycan biosynthesis transport protein ExoP
VSAATFLQDDAPAPLDVKSLIAGLGRRWRLIVAIPVVFLLLAAGALKIIPPRYKSVVEVLVYDPQRPAMGMDPGAAREPDTEAINTEIAVLTSSALARRVADTLKLYNDPEFQTRGLARRILDRLGISFGGDSASAPVSDAQRLTIAAAILRTHLAAERVPLSYVLAVSAVAHDPHVAQRLASTLVSDYLAGQQQASQAALAQTAAWLKDKLGTLNTHIAETSAAMEKLKLDNGISDAGKGTLADQQISDLNAELMLVRADAAEKKARLDQAQTGAGTLPDTPALSQLRLQQSYLIRQEQQLQAQLGPTHARVTAIAAQLAGIKKAITDELAREATDLQNSYDVAMRREHLIETNVQKLRDVQSSSGAAAKLQDLQRTADADTKLYDSYAARLNDVQSTQMLGTSDDRIISPAPLPTVPSFPPQALILFGAAAFGLGLGVALALLLEFIGGAAKLGFEAEQLYGYPVVGNIPFEQRRRLRGAATAEPGPSLLQTFMDAPLSPLSEAIRIVRIGLRLPSLEHGPKVVLVTSAMPGEGKSSVAVLLAASAAAARQRTVIVDCDMRGRTISHDFGAQRPGLTDLLSGKADLADVIHHDERTGCYYIPAGTNMPHSGDLLASKSMVEALARLRRDFDYVIIDTPPMLSAVDALALATMADKILFVVDASNVLQVSIMEALRLLRSESNRIAGIVFNKVADHQLRRIGLYKTSVVRPPGAVSLTGPV